MRIALALIATLLLCGCNMVYSNEPLFSLADEGAAPELRPGLWIRTDPACAFDSAMPTKSWPECASAIWVTSNHQVADPQDHDKTAPYVLAAGDPRVLQTLANDALSAAPGAYIYLALRPLKFDNAGRIVVARSWTVQCGPPPPKSSDPAHPNNRTLAPSPGLVMDADSSNCIAPDAKSLRNAARASEAWNDTSAGPSLLRWVRDGSD